MEPTTETPEFPSCLIHPIGDVILDDTTLRLFDFRMDKNFEGEPRIRLRLAEDAKVEDREEAKTAIHVILQRQGYEHVQIIARRGKVYTGAKWVRRNIWRVSALFCGPCDPTMPPRPDDPC